jgi:ribonuclease D
MNDKTALQRRLLVDLRSKLVGANHTLPFTIYNDDTIEELLKAQPTSMEELTQVKGFPAEGKRVKGFGESIVRIFTETEKIISMKVDTTESELIVGVELKPMSIF